MLKKSSFKFILASKKKQILREKNQKLYRIYTDNHRTLLKEVKGDLHKPMCSMQVRVGVQDVAYASVNLSVPVSIPVTCDRDRCEGSETITASTTRSQGQRCMSCQAC